MGLLPENGLDASGSEEPRKPREVALGINEKGKFNSTPVARVRVFMPRLEESGQHELSSYCVDGLPEEDRWELLAPHVSPLLARVELPTDAIRHAGLTVDPDWDPERHVNIVGWPPSLEERKAIAQEALAKVQRFVLRPVAA